MNGQFLLLVSTFTWTLIILAACVLVALIVVAAISRHKKSATGDLEIIGERGVACGALEPSGSVIVNGELWPAVSVGGKDISDGEPVLVTGAKGSHLEVRRL